MSQFKTLNDRLSYLYALERKGIKIGLEHTKELLKRCGNPHDSFPSIHIAGTNGKGSTSAMIDSILRTAGYKVGLYTSPHLIRFNERVRVNGIPISDKDIIRFVDQHHQDIETIDSTFFESTTALAFRYFSKQKVDIAIIETGLGGRLDSTNVVTPKISVITPVDIDHINILGSDIRKIAQEKAGIIKKGVPLVLARQSPVVKETILSVARKMKSQVHYLDELNDIRVSKTITSFSWEGKNYKTNLIGSYQAKNAVLAMKTATLFDKRITLTQLRDALTRIIWPGRMQVMSSTPLIIYDVAHNAHGLINLFDSIKQMTKIKPLGVISIKEDKDIVEIADVIRNKFEQLVVTTEPNAGVISAEILEETLRLHGIPADKIERMENAVIWLKTHLKENQLGLIFGSHYIGQATFNAFEFSFDRGVI